MRATLLFLGGLTACSTTPDKRASVPIDSGVTPDSGTTDTFECPAAGAHPAPPTGVWTPAGIAPGGDIVFLTEAPTAPGTVYAGSPDNGLYRSTDRGDLWLDLPIPITHTRGPIAVHPDDPDLIAVSTGFVWVSTDAGQNWTMHETIGGHAPELEVHGISWVGDTLWAIAGNSVIYRGDAFGTSWSNLGDITPIVPDAPPHLSRESDRWWGIEGNSTALFAAQHEGQVWRSTDGGIEWTPILDTGGTTLDYRSLRVDGDTLHVATRDSVYTSTDGGDTFTSVYIAEHAQLTHVSPHPDGWLLVSGHGGVFRIDPDDTVSQLYDDTLDAGSALAMADGTLLVGHPEGIVRSTDDGATWTEVDEGLRDADLATLWVHPDCAGVVWTGTQCERGLFKSTDYGTSWLHEPTYMHYTMVVAGNPSRPDEVWVTTDDQVLFTRDLGEVWIDGVPDDLRFHYHGLGIDPFAPDTVLIGSVGSGTYADTSMHVYRTDDSGQTWVNSSDGLPDTDGSAHAFVFSPDTPGVVLLGTYAGGDIAHIGPGTGTGLYRSTDHGLSWTHIDGPPDNVSQLEWCDGRVYAATSEGVLASDDEGLTWTNLWSGPDETLAVDCQDDHVAAWSGDGSFGYSADRGATWEDWSGGLPVVPNPGFSRLYDIQFAPDASFLYFAFRSEGVFQRGIE